MPEASSRRELRSGPGDNETKQARASLSLPRPAYEYISWLRSTKKSSSRFFFLMHRNYYNWETRSLSESTIDM